jgi:hypothetical protein
MSGALDEITGEVEDQYCGVTISCNGWELELSNFEAKQLMEFLNNEIIQKTEEDDSE